MSDFKTSQIPEISAVIFTFFLPFIIAVVIIYLIGLIFKEISLYGSNNLLILSLEIAILGLLSYFEVKILRWLIK